MNRSDIMRISALFEIALGSASLIAARFWIGDVYKRQGSMCIVLLQTVQKLVCILSRTIIKGKCDQRAFLLSIVRTILIKIIIVYPLGHPAGLHRCV